MIKKIVMSGVMLVAASSVAMAACDLTPREGLALTSDDQALLQRIGAKIELGNVIGATLFAGLFVTPGGLLTLAAADADTVERGLTGVSNIVASSIVTEINLHLIDLTGDREEFFEELRDCFDR